ncbi:Transcriptional regulator containing an amidase domain and an AraC-type DNA-binding HTH domain [Variovorax sp. HW608]|uniref:AraC-like ligand-binding domain-containing protein n=1 Tax=Variovorax sp. HW608 TaxID=1034889 RepID=UPI00081F79BF|nr:AraC family transcriptional regulator [Variovorax sp. HW608]SCK24801.1 Transcriptional regulator containing an amidase domain and an AraC-type DNA-binding HTH domain [Variovorax sp. HW608]
MDPIETEPLPLSRHVLFHTRDVDQARESVARVFCPHALNPCHAGELLDARHHSAPLGEGCSLNYVQYGAAVDIDPGHLGTFYLLQIPVRGGATVWCGGRELRSDTGVASLPSPSEPLHMRWAADSPQLIVQLSQAAVARQFEQLAQQEPRGSLVFEPGVDLNATPVAGIAAFVRYLCSTLDADPGFSGSVLARQAEAYLISSLLLQLPHNHRALLDAGRRPLLPRVVRRTQDYMRANAAEPLTLADLCSHVGVSARSLQQAFLNATGESPMSHWRGLRLELVRQALRAAEPGSGSDTVARIAEHYGFFHAGHFAAHYRRRFGERPGQTLRLFGG